MITSNSLRSLRSALTALVLVVCSQSAIADKAVFAGGCFWCMEQAYQDLPGVEDVVSGFTGGELQKPTYRGNHRGHWEAIEVTYDAKLISYQELLDHYWINIDPFDNRGQFCDKGASYRSAIFAVNPEQETLAQASLTRVEQRFPQQAVATDILPGNTFWPVEDAHQDYYLKNPIRYKFYKSRCGRTGRLEQIWGKKS
jgi:peptide-methionine (S)-S-oxide reductase